MATRKTSRSSSKPAGGSRRTGRTTRATRATRATRTTRTTRRTASSTARSPTGALYPRRRRSRPGLPTTVGTALGTLVVTTLLDLSWPVRVGLIAVVVVVGLGYVVWRHRAEITAAGATGEPLGTTPPTSDPTGPDATPPRPTPPSG